MVKMDNFRVLDDEERSQFKFDFCELCEFHECELVQEYEQYKESHNNHSNSNRSGVKVMPFKSDDKVPGTFYVEAKAVPLENENKETDVIAEGFNKPLIAPLKEDNSYTCALSYNEKELEEGCIMSSRHVYQIECGSQRVTEGIGDHFKIDTDNEGNIKEGTTDRWEPLHPVFISAQTGRGKNYFIENTLIPYVRELNYKNKTKQKVLILSNRLALKQQIMNRCDENDVLDDGEKIYPYKGCADVMTYQSLLRYEKYLKREQEKPQSRYIFVICDEAHFFTSDAMFNPHTKKILEAIVRLFQDAVRVYMSATPYECLEYIIKHENEY